MNRGHTISHCIEPVSKFLIDFMPLLSNIEFLLSAEWIGADATVISGGVGFGI